MSLSSYLQAWGKARPDEAGVVGWHPVAYHCLDVAACARAILLARPRTVERVSMSLALPPDDASALIVLLAALHDLGKFADSFQKQVPELWPPCYGARPEIAGRQHTETGFSLWHHRLRTTIGKRLVPTKSSALRPLMLAAFGHHGRPLRGGEPDLLYDFFKEHAIAAAVAFANDVLTLPEIAPLMSRGLVLDADRTSIASWLVNGILSTADWIGSHQSWFPYHANTLSVAEYWETAKTAAADAVHLAGLVPPTPAPARSFSELTGIPSAPSDLQQWATDVPLPDGPAFVLLEDVTGSGKTEAAHILVHRLMTAGRVTGAYWAMPTQATANGMYERQGKMIGKLYDASSATPSLILAHGQSRLHDGFRSTVLTSGADLSVNLNEENRSNDGETDSVVACAAFLADNRRAALLADVGAGTIDQALLAVLPSKFNTIRLFGLADKVLVLDEVHGYDAYMFAELRALIRFQAALGGSVVILSATLPQLMRTKLLREWTTASEERNDTPNLPYPLATWVGKGGVIERRSIQAMPNRRVDARITWRHQEEQVVDDIVRASRAGAAVVWIRNTVGTCRKAAALLRERGIEPVVFHARFAQCDRQLREAQVVNRLGKASGASERNGLVVVATQVVEQSLDLDFDLLITDLAPIDLLIQRRGRLWRHQRSRQGVAEAEMIILAPPFEERPDPRWLDTLLPGTKWVYRDPGVLWRTYKALCPRADVYLKLPEQLRDLIESVYGREALNDYPTSFDDDAAKAWGKALADTQTAANYVLSAERGWTAENSTSWDSDIHVPTRLTDNQTVIRLARRTVDGAIEPWASGALGVAANDRRAWPLSEVRVKARDVSPGASSMDRDRKIVDQIRETWAMYERETPIAVLDGDDETWSGALVNSDGKVANIVYDRRDGLVVR